ncbi:MAG: glycoside hydrolase family 66 protein, partial [Chitinophagaceae bacterium]|nr:glycoside hydrolase family 66 protein [Chitinophagaceae bacterium]
MRLSAFRSSRQILCIIISGTICWSSCKKDTPQNDPVTYGNSFVLTINADKAVYKPGETVRFSINKPLTGNLKIRYRHLMETISDAAFSGDSWSWTAPATDFTGYMVDIYETVDGKEKIYASVGIDISSSWAKFPRYGFLSKYGQLSDADIKKVMDDLTRHHINGLQFYDWQYKHHMPLAGSAAAPQAVWKDLSNRDVYLSTLRGYIDAAHQRGMQAMFYNLAFGALSDAAADGVKEEWYAFKDKLHTTKDKHALPLNFFKSDIYVTDAGNTNWQQYIAARHNDVYQALNFDGFHIDQLGDRGALYTYNGTAIDQAATFKPFIQAMKTAQPNKKLVMNAVNQYGQAGLIATAPVDFLYTEVWGPNDGYSHLADIIRNNDYYGNNTKPSILAAYMNYNKADQAGYFNTPGVLLTDAVIFAFGGAHIELGEHMLGKEYFPNNNLLMPDELRNTLVQYYDFMVAYENLLRDGGTFNSPAVNCTNGKATINNWPPAKGSVSAFGKEFANRQVLHFLNFNNANSLEWRDNNGTQAKPATIENMEVEVNVPKTVKRVWIASPDYNNGVASTISFTQSGNTVKMMLPSLQYWDM